MDCDTRTQAVGDDDVALESGPVFRLGPGTFDWLENPEIWGGIIDLDPKPVDARDEVNQLADAIGLESTEDQRAFRQRQSLVPRVAEFSFDEPPSRKLAFNPGGTYLITGGLGGLGLQVARSLVDRGARRLVLVGRAPCPSGQPGTVATGKS